MKVYILFYGEGCDGDERSVEQVFATREAAERYRQETHGIDFRKDPDRHEIEGWDVLEGKP